MRKWLLLLRTLLAVLCWLWSVPGMASASMVCEQAARHAAERTDVPLSILRAVTLAETGQTRFDEKRLAAWPWAVQAEMTGHWFPDAPSAIAFAQSLISQGKSNIDIGCFQLNIRWHSKAFQSLEDMFSPERNALYAANFLSQLYQETGDWRSAVGRYHSRNLDLAEAYLQRLETLFERHLSHSPLALEASQTITAARAITGPQRFGLISARGPLIQAPLHIRPIIGGSP